MGFSPPLQYPFLMFLTASTCSGADVPLRKTSRNLQTIVVAVKWTQVREVKGCGPRSRIQGQRPKVELAWMSCGLLCALVCVWCWLCVYLLCTWEFREEVCSCVLSVVLVV